MPNNDDLAVKREAARRAMEGDERRVKREMAEAELEKKRKIAMEAMEGYERRIKHEMELKAIQDQAIIKQHLEEEQKKQAEEAQLRHEREEAAKRANEEEQQRERELRAAGARQSEEIIAEIVGRPEPKVNAIHTIKSDIANAAKTGKLSMAKIMAKEKETRNLTYTGDIARRAIAAIKRQRRITLLIALGLCLVIISAAYWWKTPTIDQEVVTTKPIVAEPLVFVEEQKEINATNIESDRLIQEIINQKNLPAKRPDTVSNLYFVRTKVDTQSPSSQKEILGLTGFLKATNINLPEEFTKYLSEKFMLGAYKRTPASIFIVLKVRSYENSSINLLAQENGIVGSLLIPLSQTPFARDFAERSFSDKIIKNLHTRVLMGSKGKIEAVYGFVDERTIVIAEDEDTFVKAVTSYSTPQPVTR